MRSGLTGLLCLLAAMMLASVVRAEVACPPGDENFPPFYSDANLFTGAIAKVVEYEPSNERLSGIIVPHHLLADRLVALGFKAASAFRYKRIVILSPDHFRRSAKMFATTTRGFETPLGTVKGDALAAARLVDSGLVEESCLFAKEHGVQAMLPFVRHYFPETPVVAVAISIRSKRQDWDRLEAALEAIVDADTLVVQSTDFSHYLPQHEAKAFDQQTLNLLAAGSLDGLAALNQPDHADSVGALYIQAKLQKRLFGAAPLVVANENSQRYSQDFAASTTSYMIAIYGKFSAAFNSPAAPQDKIYYLAGDTNFGRGMKMALLGESAAEAVSGAILGLTHGRPLIVNLEGVILPDVPGSIDNMTLAMPEDLAISWLRKLNVAGVGLANNHAFDLGPSGYEETRRSLAAAGIPAFGQGERLALPGVDLVGLTDIDTNGSRQTDLLTPELLDRLVTEDASRPTVAFVHWGREYVTSPSSRESMLADQMRLRSVPLIVGAHPHVASPDLIALGGGDTLLAYSLGNFLFDQNAARASGIVLELRVFEQGTIFVRPIPLPNLFDMAGG